MKLLEVKEGILMFKIGEFSKLTQVSIRMLRYYDEIGILKPAEIDRFSSYRLYSIEQIPKVNKIIFLRDLGFSIAEISTAINKWDDNFIANELQQKQKEIMDMIEAERDKLSKIEIAMEDIKKEKIHINYSVSIKNIPSYKVLSLRKVVPNYYSEGDMWIEMSNFAKENNISISDNTFSIYHDTEYKEKEVDIELCAVVEKFREDKGGFIYRHTEGVPLMASTMVYGDFKNIGKAYLSFGNWLQEHKKYKMTGESRQIVHRGPWNEENPKDYLIEIQIALEEKI